MGLSHDYPFQLKIRSFLELKVVYKLQMQLNVSTNVIVMIYLVFNFFMEKSYQKLPHNDKTIEIGPAVMVYSV